ncbi:MAG TPA: glutamate 5-kinase, partial [Tissierellales bacterium]|nr:glutamate 5-kinase [Tissierellales bacterium]
ILVSSGAGAAGANTIGKWSRKGDLHYKQALCAIGQVELMDSYRRTFDQYGIHIAQILLTKEDFDSSQRTMNIRNTLFTLMDEGVIPIVNENDTVSTDEIKIGDNDILAANTAVVWGADLLVLLSRIDGIYDSNPSTHGDAHIIPMIEDIDSLEEKLSLADPESTKAGGIKTKLKAAKLANKYGIPMIVVHGKIENVIKRIAEGDIEGTLFAPHSK